MLTQRADHGVTAHAGVAHHAHGDHFTAGMLQIAQTIHQIVGSEIVVKIVGVARVLCDAETASGCEFGGVDDIAILEADYGEVLGKGLHGLDVRRRWRKGPWSKRHEE